MSSRRKSKRAPKRYSKYNEGDLVEITRGEKVLKARLAQLLTAGTSPNPRWLIKFEGPYRDEEVYEKSIDRLLEATTSSPSVDAPSSQEEPEIAYEPAAASQEATAPSEGGSSSDNNQTSVTRNGGESSAREERRKHREQHVFIKKVVKKPVKKEHVTKVKMLTGTLYLYRGPQRRVEFVRRT